MAPASTMCFIVTVKMLLLLGMLCASDVPGSLRDFEEDIVTAMDHESWRSIEPYQTDSQDWLPAEGPIPLPLVSSEEEPVLKRRRPVRKRKRRPQLYERDFVQDDETYPDRLPARSRNRRPQRLDQRREQWPDEMMAEEPYRPLRTYNRRRLYPKYEEEETVQDDEKGMYRDEETTIDGDFKQMQPIKIFNSDESRQSEIVEKVRDPYSALNEEQESRRRPHPKRKYIHRNPNEFATSSENNVTQSTDRIDTDSPNPIDLKTLLKQSANISLSELLQQKNLSLADLLKGEQHAISALTENPAQTMETHKHANKLSQKNDTKETVKPKRYNSDYRRLPVIRSYEKQNENSNTLTLETTTSTTTITGATLDKQQKSTSVRKENKFIVQTDLAESTTERRIFVPSHPKYYTSVDYKPSIMDFNTERISTSTTQPEKISESTSIVSSTITFSTSEYPPSTKSKSLAKNRPRNALPTTFAKLKSLSAKTTMKSVVHDRENMPKVSSVPPKAFHINVNEIFGMPKLLNDSKTTEGPLKISVNIEEMIEKSKGNEVASEYQAESEILLNDQAQDYENTKLNAKDEIMEILSDNASRENLTRLLKSRNMTLKELIEQRERGSSQRHLADIFHNQTKEPEPSEQTIVQEVLQNISQETNPLHQPSLYDAFPVRQNATKLKPTKDAHYYQTDTKTRESRQNQFQNKQLDNYKIIANPVYQTTEPPREAINKFLPLWREAYNSLNKNDQKLLSDKLSEDELIMNDEAQRIEDIENKLAEAVNGALNINMLEHKLYNKDEENEFLRLPYGVRSAIIASLVIGGISLCVFLTIFIVFKWTHKKRKHLSYSNSFSSSKIKTPILQQPYQKRIFETLMNSTLGRKKKICTIYNDPQNLQEYLWDNERKPFQ